MTLTKRINDQLQKAPSGQSSEIRAFDDKLRVEVKLGDSGRLGSLLESLHIEPGENGNLAFDPVQIAGQVTYLAERLEIIETEGEAGRTILRSTPPRVDGKVVSFFEMVLDRSRELSLVRYEYDPKTEVRKPVPAPLTRDTLERLIGDLVELASGN